MRGGASVKLENKIFGWRFARILHAMRLACRVEDDTVWFDSLPKRLDFSLQYDNGSIISIDMRVIP
jgi:hypothetical protein